MSRQKPTESPLNTVSGRYNRLGERMLPTRHLFSSDLPGFQHSRIAFLNQLFFRNQTIGRGAADF